MRSAFAKAMPALVATAAIATVSAIAWAGAEWSGEDLSAWVSAAATLAALVAAAVAAMFAAAALRLENEREDRWQFAQRRGQASLVAAWPGELLFVPGPQDEDTGVSPEQFIAAVTVHLRNASEVPVTGVEVSATATLRWFPIGDGFQRFGPLTVGPLPPGSDAIRFVVPFAEEAFDLIAHDVTAHEISHDLEVTMRFRDSAGVVWHRIAGGILLEDEPPDGHVDPEWDGFFDED